MIESILFTAQVAPDGSVTEITADRFPEEILISTRLMLGEHDRRFMQVDEGGVTFTLTNATARYAFTGERHHHTAMHARLASVEMAQEAQ